MQQSSARDFWKQALCRLHAMFICNQTKVNGRILPCNTTKHGFIILTPSGFMDPGSTHHMTALSMNFPSAMSHSVVRHYILWLQSSEPPPSPPRSTSPDYKMYTGVTLTKVHRCTLSDI